MQVAYSFEMTSFLIRPAERSDIEACVDLLAVPEMQQANGDFPGTSYIEAFLGAPFFVAMAGRRQVGLIFGEFLRSGGAIIWGMVVHEDYKKQGIGTALVNHFETYCATHSRSWIVLYGISENNFLQHFYEKKGFQKGTRVDEYLKVL